MVQASHSTGPLPSEYVGEYLVQWLRTLALVLGTAIMGSTLNENYSQISMQCNASGYP